MKKHTTDHNKIRKWSERYGGRPALIDQPEAVADQVGIRLDFPGEWDEVLLSDAHSLKTISWEEFFEEFERQELVFVYEDEPQFGDPVDWYRFRRRE